MNKISESLRTYKTRKRKYSKKPITPVIGRDCNCRPMDVCGSHELIFFRSVRNLKRNNIVRCGRRLLGWVFLVCSLSSSGCGWY